MIGNWASGGFNLAWFDTRNRCAGLSTLKLAFDVDRPWAASFSKARMNASSYCTQSPCEPQRKRLVNSTESVSLNAIRSEVI